MFETYNWLTIHQRNMQVLMTEIYKIANGVASSIMNSLSEFRSNKYNIRIFKYSQLTSKNRILWPGNNHINLRHPFGPNYHLDINLQVPLKNVK